MQLCKSADLIPWGFSSVAGCTGPRRDKGCHPGCWAWKAGWHVTAWTPRRPCWSCVTPRVWNSVSRSCVWRSQAWSTAGGNTDSTKFYCICKKTMSLNESPAILLMTSNTENVYSQFGCTLVGVSGMGEDDAGDTHLLPRQLLSSSMSS